MNTPSEQNRAVSAARCAWRRGQLIGRLATALASTYAPLLLADETPAGSTPSPVASAAMPPSPAAGGQDNASVKKSVWTGAPVVVTAKSSRYAAAEASSATRTDSPLIEVPQSVQVLTRSLIDEQDRRTLTDALVNVSGVTPTRPEEALFTQPIVRGFPAEIYLDGLPAFGPTAAIDPTSLTGVERIEVVKGPTSTVYGGGAGAPLGGLINVVSERPQAERSGYVALRAGSFSTWNPYLDVDTPLATGVDARLTADYQSNGSSIDEVHGERWSVQPSVSFQLHPDTDLLVRGQYSRRSNLEYSGLPAAQALAGQVDRDAFPGAPIGQPQSTVQNSVETIEFRHAFSDDMRLNVAGRYDDSRSRDYGSFIYPEWSAPDPATPTTYPIFSICLPTDVKERMLDANVSAHVDALGGEHRLLAGVNADRTDYDSAMGFDGVPVGELDLARPDYTLAFGAIPSVTITQTNRYGTLAGYVQDQATYGRFHLLASLRLTRFDLHQIEQGIDSTYRRMTPRVGVSFDVSRGVALYAAYATGFRGALNFVGLAPPKPETSRNVEGGLKLALSDIGLSGTVAAFQQTRRHVSTVDPANPLYSIQTGEQRARGVEADLVWEPTSAFSLLANYAYTDAEVTQDTVIPIGHRLPRVPRHSGRIAARYRVLGGAGKGLSFGMGITAFGRRQLTLPNTVSVPGSAMVDAQAAYDVGRYTVAVSALNLAGRKGFDTYQYLSFPVVIPVQPRSAYVTLTVHF